MKTNVSMAIMALVGQSGELNVMLNRTNLELTCPLSLHNIHQIPAYTVLYDQPMHCDLSYHQTNAASWANCGSNKYVRL